jgi:DNA-binding GntR family transcriptional regulator
MKKGRAIEETYKEIKDMMYYNELAPGQKLIYQQLAKRLNVSITPITQALSRLKDSNLVEYIPNKGYFVREITESEVNELYEARAALETWIVPAIVQNIDSQKLKEIGEYFRQYNNEHKNHRLLIVKDAQFHLRIAEISNNSVICRILAGVFEEICIKYRPDYMGRERIGQAVREHRKILNALKKRDRDEAIAMIIEHNRMGRQHVLDSLKRNRGVRFSEDFSWPGVREAGL